MMSTEGQPRYLEPTRGTRIFNSAVGRMTKLGISVYGSRVLAVRGRKSGEWRTTPVNPLRLDGERYLVSPRGTTQWVRNMRAAGGGELRIGRRVERFTVTEVPVEERPAILRAYLKKWKFEVGMFFQGVGPDSPDEKLLAIAPDHPVFRISR
jgi:deazaflavin-dependent oxidoreductase (nitroreductase family)